MTRHEPVENRATTGDVPLTAGPRWYKRRIRTLGPLFGLVPMAVLGAIALIALQVPESRPAGTVALVAGTSAAPGLLVAGVPFADDSQFPLAIVASIPLWLVLGLIAGFRATRRPIATWSDYARELIYLSLAVIVGATVALFVAAAVVGEPLVV